MTKNRRELFREAKEAAGSVENLIAQVKAAPYRVYFDNNGTIVAFTNAEVFMPQATWTTYDFSQEQLEILKDKDLTRYVVVQDKTTENLYHIKARPTELAYMPADAFLTELTNITDLRYKLTKKYISISMCNEIKSGMNIASPTTALYNGKKYLKFYITAKNDPHMLLQTMVVSVESLILNDDVIRTMPADFSNGSVYVAL